MISMGPATAWRWWDFHGQRRSFQFFIALLVLLNIAASVEAAGAEPTKIALLGGSMSIRGAKQLDQTFIKQSHKWMETAFVPGCSEQVRVVAEAQDKKIHAQALEAAKIRHKYPDPPPPPRIPQHDALHVVSIPWYQQSGHVCNGSHIELHHLSVPAAGPDYTESCVLQHVPDDADLVIIEFACNDYMDPQDLRTSERMAYERMIRTALNLPNKPAVLLFEVYCYKQSKYTFDGELELAEEKHHLAGQVLWQRAGKAWLPDWLVLSARSAFFDYVKGTADVHHDTIYDRDIQHLNERGHRWYSDLIINYIRHIALRLATRVVAVELGGWHHLLLPHSLSHSTGAGGSRTMLQDKQQMTGGQRARRALLDVLGQDAKRVIEEEIVAEQNISSSYCAGARWMVEGKREAEQNESGVHCEGARWMVEGEREAEQNESGVHCEGARWMVEGEREAEQNKSGVHCEGARWMVEGKREAEQNKSGVHCEDKQQGAEQKTSSGYCEVQGSQAGPRAEGPGESQTMAYRLALSQFWLVAAKQAQKSKTHEGARPSHTDRHFSILVRGTSAGPRAEGPGESQTIAYRLKCSHANGKTMLKQPFFKGNEIGGVGGVCAVGPDFTQVVESSDGWEWVDEAADGTSKYGYASTQVGAELIIRINMTVVPGQSNSLTEVMNMGNVHSQLPPNLLEASLIHLKGYKDMGKASLTCSGLCHCHPVTVNGIAVDQKIQARTPQLRKFYILGNSSLTGSGLVCKVMVKLLGKPNEANPNVNYFKVIGITTSSHSIFHATEIFSKSHNFFGLPGGEAALDEIGNSKPLKPLRPSHPPEAPHGHRSR
eukprot:gene7714-882_t